MNVSLQRWMVADHVWSGNKEHSKVGTDVDGSRRDAETQRRRDAKTQSGEGMLATEEMLEVGKILRGGEFGVGQWVVDQGDGMAEAGDGGGLVGDATVFFFDLTVGL